MIHIEYSCYQDSQGVTHYVMWVAKRWLLICDSSRAPQKIEAGQVVTCLHCVVEYAWRMAEPKAPKTWTFPSIK